MKIRITHDTKIPLVDAGRTFDVCGVSESGDGEKVYFITTPEAVSAFAPAIAKRSERRG